MVGRTNKVIEALNTAIPEVTIKPIEMIKQEMNARGAIIRGEILEKDENISDDKLFEEFKKRMAAEYKGKALTEKQFDEYINPLKGMI